MRRNKHATGAHSKRETPRQCLHNLGTITHQQWRHERQRQTGGLSPFAGRQQHSPGEQNSGLGVMRELRCRIHPFPPIQTPRRFPEQTRPRGHMGGGAKSLELTEGTAPHVR